MDLRFFPFIILGFKPFGQNGITIGPVMLIWEQAWKVREEEIRRHERIHRQQWIEIIVLAMPVALWLTIQLAPWVESLTFLQLMGFYCIWPVAVLLVPWALTYYPLLLIFGYKNHPMEREPRENQNKISYIINRRAFAWMRRRT